MRPVLRHIANLWTLLGHPTRKQEWSLDEKLQAISEAGFDGVCWAPSPELHEGVQRYRLIFLGGMACSQEQEFGPLIHDLKRYGAHHVNVQLASDHVLTPEALRLTLALMSEANKLDLAPAIESHRGTCTETPEKLYALADAYQAETGEMLRISWDFSHFAVVKHLVPENFARRLLLRPELVQYAQQFHFRPFNGHHVQLPVTDQHGELVQEVRDWLPFARAILECWIAGNSDSGREIFVCPELGPLEGGYGLSTFPNSWEDAKRLRLEIQQLWDQVIG